MSTIPVLDATEAERWIDERARLVIDREARDAVAPILEEVRAGGDAALREFTERFDGVKLSQIEIPRSDRQKALASLPVDRRRALEDAIASLETFHRTQLREEQPVEVKAGVTVWRVFRAIERVGIYVPGGRADYPSSVLMCGVPARLAGCRSISICVPPGPPDPPGPLGPLGPTGPEERPPASVLAAAELLQVDHVYSIGGAQAVAALAFGTESVIRVDKIFGPGNRYVTAAKELVFGAVDIDMPAGSTEIVVLADETAKPAWVAADLVAQAEHAPDVLAVCITTDMQAAAQIADDVERLLGALPEPAIARESLAGSAVCMAPSIDAAIEWANLIAPEHLAIVTNDDEGVVERIEHAGSVFMGPFAPVAAGDYATGSNHVLPTGRRARAWSALSVDDFGRWMQVQSVTAAGLASIAETVSTLARWEGFEAHARAVEARFQEGS